MNDLDCNNCVNLNLTESEQEKLRDNTKNHECTFYDKRIFHMSNSRKNHKAKLHPCSECIIDNFKNYEEKNKSTSCSCVSIDFRKLKELDNKLESLTEEERKERAEIFKRIRG